MLSENILCLYKQALLCYTILIYPTLHSTSSLGSHYNVSHTFTNIYFHGKYVFQCVSVYVNLHKDYLAVGPIRFLMFFTQLSINVLCCGGFIECILVKFIFIQIIFITKKEKEHSILF